MTITVKNAGGSDVRTFDAENIKIEDLQYVRAPLWTAHSHDNCKVTISYEAFTEEQSIKLSKFKRLGGFKNNHWSSFRDLENNAWARIEYTLQLAPKLLNTPPRRSVQPEISDECAENIINNIMEDVKIWKGIKK
jgi:hypothetical protein